MSIDITEEKFNEYKEIQMDSSYNMFDPRARQLTSLSEDEWETIMKDYTKLNDAWGNDEID
jgi:hypothetical protein|tara:strand:+ start:59 stop:241 length:183 start_codon:yes stop_codon:yes gene_type:complete